MAAERLYMVGNWTRPTTAAPVPRATGTAIRTLLQLAALSTEGLAVVEWGISFDGAAAGVPINVELFKCTGAASGLTALAATDVSRQSAPLGTETIPLQYGTALSGYAPGAGVTEGTVANHHTWDAQLIAPTSQYVKQWPLGREPACALSEFIRIRVTAPANVNALCYIVFSGA
jgi:hypothetical protein